MSLEMLDADTHTISDGAMARFLKMRKWMALTAACLFLIDSGLLNFGALAAAFFVPTMSKEWAHFSLSVAAIYQLVMGSLVLLQLSDDYWPQVLKRAGLEKMPASLVEHQLLRANRRAAEAHRDAEAREAEGAGEAEVATAKGVASSEDRNYRELWRSINQHRRRRWRVYFPELTIDAMRVFPTIALSASAVFLHARVWPIAMV